MADVSMQAMKNGPMVVKGTIELKDSQGQIIETSPAQPVALCRCGHSEKKPFCDGSHRKVNFQG